MKGLIYNLTVRKIFLTTIQNAEVTTRTTKTWCIRLHKNSRKIIFFHHKNQHKQSQKLNTILEKEHATNIAKKKRSIALRCK